MHLLFIQKVFHPVPTIHKSSVLGTTNSVYKKKVSDNTRDKNCSILV